MVVAFVVDELPREAWVAAILPGDETGRLPSAFIIPLAIFAQLVQKCKR
ncbi:hypothetical protein [Paraburkholderia sp. HP33-1]|nr:hypothetical protein [Paraburkholderia sp. HP33-1]